jgi:hypothetical protein
MENHVVVGAANYRWAIANGRLRTRVLAATLDVKKTVGLAKG